MGLCEYFRPFVGRQIHGLVCKHRFEDDVYVGSALIHMYAKCFDMRCAQKVFDETPDRIGDVAILKFSQPKPDDLVYVDSVSVEEIGGTRVTIVKNEEGETLYLLWF